MRGMIVALGRLGGREAAAQLIDGRLEELRIASAMDMPPGAEAMFRARMERPAKGLGGSFVALPGGLSGFMKRAQGFRAGQPVIVQVSGHAEAGKALPVTSRLLFKGRYAIVTPGAPGLNVARGIRDAETRARLAEIAARAPGAGGDEPGVIIRSAAAHAPTEDILAELAELIRECSELQAQNEGKPALLRPAPGPHAIALREWTFPRDGALVRGADVFAEHGIDEHVAALLKPVVELPGGASMSIEATRALIAVDVDTGGDMSPASGLKANIAAARELPRQLRLRGLGGQIVVDFAPMPKRERQVLEQTLRSALRAEDEGATMVGWTPLGHFELQRRRDRPPLADLIALSSFA